MLKNEHLAEKRKTILVAAERIFDAHGYAATTVESIAAEAGIAKGSIYKYFESKEDLFRQVFSSFVTSQLGEVENVVRQEAPAAEKLGSLLDFWFERLGRFHKIGRLVLEFWATAARDEQRKEDLAGLAEAHRQSKEVLACILSEGRATGEFPREFDIPTAAALITAIMDGIQIQLVLNLAPQLDAEYLAAMKRGILTALGAPAESGSRQATNRAEAKGTT